MVIVLLCLGLYLPGISALPPTDRDESRFSQASRQMVETGDYIRIRFQEEPRHKKPVGIHWLQVASVKALGGAEINRIWLYRLPSVLGGILASLFVFLFFRKLFDPSTALLAAGLTACSLLLVTESHIATTDAALLACVAAAQGALALVYIRTREDSDVGYGLPLIFWTALGFGVLTKGPIAPLVSLLTLIGLSAADRRILWMKALRPLPGFLLFALIVIPWGIAIYKATGGKYFQQAVGEDLLPKILAGVESHGGAPGYYLLLMPITFWPGSIFFGLTLFCAWKNRSRPIARFCLAWLIPSWIMFELVPTKLPHYVLPTYPALALLTAEAIFALRKGEIDWPRFWPRRLAVLLWSFVSVGTALAMVLLPWVLDRRVDFVAVGAAVASIALLIPTVKLTLRNRVVESIGTACLGALLVLAPALQYVLPGINALWLSRSVARTVQAHAAAVGEKAPLIAAVGYHEPSLVFMTNTSTKLTSAADAAELLAKRVARFAVVDKDSEEAFLRAAAEANAAPRLIEDIRGYHYSKGRWTNLRVYLNGSGPR